MNVTRTPRAALATVMAVAAFAPSAMAGEPKNEVPFTRTIAPTSQPIDVAGERKNGPPFTQPVPDVKTVVVRGGNGFDWSAAALGAAAGIGAALAAAGGITLALGSQRRLARPVA
jgi:hypothetical protein